MNPTSLNLQELKNDTPIEDHFGKHLPALDVLSISIKFMKDQAIKYLEDSGVPYPETETKWVITVPAIWSDPAKQVTRAAAEKVCYRNKFQHSGHMRFIQRHVNVDATSVLTCIDVNAALYKRNDVELTSMQRHDVAATLTRR